MLESKDLTKVFGNKTAVDHVSLKLDAGHIVALLGPNGSGKTTWMKMVTGLIKPSSGSMLFRGEPIGLESRKHIAYMSTEPYFYTWMTVRDVGRYYEDFFEDYSAQKYEAMLGKMELDMQMKTKTLSSGMMAKLKIAVTMARDARVYMLDEPFNGIDLLARDEIRHCILREASESKVLLLSSHLVEEMEAVCDTAVFIKQGKLIEVRNLEEMRETDHVSMADRYREIYGHTEVSYNE